MPIFNDRRSVAAGASVDNVLTGSLFERMPYNATIAIAINGDAAGHEVLADVYSGTDVLAESLPLNSQARIPVNPDDFQLSDVIGYMEQLKIKLRNTGTGAHVVYTSVIITPLG